MGFLGRDRTLSAVALVAGLIVGCGLPGPPSPPNACGGVTDLNLDGVAVSVGDACGDCGDGVVVCDSSSAGGVSCAGASSRNPCGGCGASPACLGNDSCADSPEDGCDGTWICDGDTPRCDLTTRNVCGGQRPLPERRSGWPCTTDEGEEGFSSCTGPDSLECLVVTTTTNPCQTTKRLDGTPGIGCGTCLRGVWTCTASGTFCEGSERGTNSCGGCGALGVEIDGACGCDGRWRCDGPNSVVCEDPGRNACGTCGALSAEPLDDCPGGVLVCNGTSGLRCEATARVNVCGGTIPLADEPGRPCGPCGDGVSICAGPDTIACAGASQRNDCGGCGPLPAALGDACGFDRFWVCDAGVMRCAHDTDFSAQCTGLPPTVANTTGVLGNVWDNCSCGGRYGCTEEGRITCLAQGGDFVYDADGDGVGGEYLSSDPVRGGRCEPDPEEPERWVPVANGVDCDDEDPNRTPGRPEIPGNGVDEDCDLRELCFVDMDEDEFGDPTMTVLLGMLSCDGAATRAGDCDDADATINEGADEICDDDMDNDCDGDVDTDDGDCG